jgi:type I restriction enzyme S subunit
MTNGWSNLKLGDVVTPSSRGEGPTPGTKYRQIGVKLWGEGAYERETIDGGQTRYAQLFRADAGDIIVNKIWARNGSVAVIPESLVGCYASGEFPMFKPNPELLDSRWMHWLTKTPGFWKQCDDKSRGTSGKNRIRPEQFLKIEVSLPPLLEQRRIVARIEKLAAKIQQARGLKQETADEAAALTSSHLNQLFGNPYTGVAGELAIKRWEKIDAVTDDVADGPHLTPTYVSEGVPFITVLNITSGRIRFDSHKFISEEDHRQFQQRAKAEKGDVLISKDGTIGVPCFVDTDREFSFFVSVALVKPRRGTLDGEFLAWAIRAPYLQERIVSRSRGDMIRHLVLREIRDLLVPVPNLAEQRRIVADLEQWHRKLTVLAGLQNETMTEIDAFMPAVLDRAFRGEL